MSNEATIKRFRVSDTHAGVIEASRPCISTCRLLKTPDKVLHKIPLKSFKSPPISTPHSSIFNISAPSNIREPAVSSPTGIRKPPSESWRSNENYARARDSLENGNFPSNLIPASRKVASLYFSRHSLPPARGGPEKRGNYNLSLL